MGRKESCVLAGKIHSEKVCGYRNVINYECVCPKKDRTCVARRSVPGSVAFVPPAAGLILASRVVRDLIGAGASSNENRAKIDDDSLEA